jgi:hypothetical protein
MSPKNTDKAYHMHFSSAFKIQKDIKHHSVEHQYSSGYKYHTNTHKSLFLYIMFNVKIMKKNKEKIKEP